MRLIDAEALVKDFSVRAVSARNWKERAIMEKNEEAIIRADATLAFLSEVKLTIDNAPTITIKEWKEEMPIYIKDAMLEALRPQGEWKQISPAKIYECTNCGQTVMTEDIECYQFCHNCGADMRKGAKNE